MTAHRDFRTAADAAQRLGVTVRALRVYERHGLVRPGRTAAGWRVYGPDEFARLHQVIALKRLGLSLKRIGEMLSNKAVGLDEVLALQEAALSAQKQTTDRALELVRRARLRLSRGETLPTDDLVNLTKETVMSDFKPSPEFEALIDKHVDRDRVKDLHPGTWTAEDQARVGAEWAALMSEADRLKDGDPSSPQALDLARRWRAQVQQFTKGDAQLTGQMTSMYKEGFSDPKMQGQMPFSPDIWKFMVEAQKRLAESEK
ncbi:MAG TPA: MerR family transcriptional regulator [Caulobacteraceae bacterium]|nr:MerR family transcriptional regulator [Caulobacteraceae bacterium]